jgi:hypothetical protein
MRKLDLPLHRECKESQYGRIARVVRRERATCIGDLSLMVDEMSRRVVQERVKEMLEKGLLVSAGKGWDRNGRMSRMVSVP